MSHGKEFEVAVLDLVIREYVVVVFFPNDIVFGRICSFSSLFDDLGHLAFDGFLSFIRTIVFFKVFP